MACPGSHLLGLQGHEKLRVNVHVAAAAPSSEDSSRARAAQNRAAETAGSGPVRVAPQLNDCHNCEFEYKIKW